MRPEGMGEDETREACRQWLQLLSYQSPNTVYSVLICHEGYLSKRGRLNTAFKKRWFVLDSEQMVCRLIFAGCDIPRRFLIY